MVGRTIAHYEITARIAQGGMGVVYRAVDHKLDRAVAIKVMREDVTSALNSARFLRESRIVARLQHPNILPVYDSGEEEGLLFYVMPLVEGETLAQRLAHERRLPIDKALQITRDIVEALAYAHAREIVHRDVKLSNVLLSSGRAMLADSGVAVALGSRQDDKLTGTGFVLGTSSYMSPEQASGSLEIGGRSDLYSVGCVLFEMLTGAPPFTGETPAAILKGHLLDAPTMLRTVRPQVPVAVEVAVDRVLSKKAADRFPNARRFLDALAGESEGMPEVQTDAVTIGAGDPVAVARPTAASLTFRQAMAGGLTLGLVVAVALWMFLPLGQPAVSETPLPIVAVLPFENLTGDASLDHVGIGTAHALVSALSTLSGVTAISRAATLQYGADSTNVTELARGLGATFVVQGVVQAVAARIQVTASVVRSDESVIWGQSYEGGLEDLFDMQRRLFRGVSQALQVSLRPEDLERFNQPPTRNRNAYAEYSQGRAFLERTDVAGKLQRGARLFESAIRRDPSFALAHAGLAESFWETYRDTLDQQWVERAMDSAEEARRLEPTRPEVRQTLAVIYEGMGRYEEALLELDGALELQLVAAD